MKKITLLDGGMGTMLQARGLAPGEHPEVFGYKHPDIIREIHKSYIEAGSRLIYANTFGANPRKLKGQPIDTKTAVVSALQSARQAADSALSNSTDHSDSSGLSGRSDSSGHSDSSGLSNQKEKVAVALDLGPIGELLEPLGTVSFEDAYEAYKEAVLAGKDAGADLILFETFTDLLDAKAAVLAGRNEILADVRILL